MSIIKICVVPGCESVAHNCNDKPTYCDNCSGRMIKINEKTYLKKFVRNPFQYDFKTNEKVFPEDLGYDPKYTEAELAEMQGMYDLIKSIKK